MFDEAFFNILKRNKDMKSVYIQDTGKYNYVVDVKDIVAFPNYIRFPYFYKINEQDGEKKIKTHFMPYEFITRVIEC